MDIGVTITEVSALAGYSRITTTQIYINSSMQELKEKIERL
ncbi:hypothetical protein [Thermoanaerobacterium butyriciformans]|nr:hypothetical protein [Thermoanaerobacterium butyriciformans]